LWALHLHHLWLWLLLLHYSPLLVPALCSDHIATPTPMHGLWLGRPLLLTVAVVVVASSSPPSASFAKRIALHGRGKPSSIGFVVSNFQFVADLHAHAAHHTPKRQVRHTRHGVRCVFTAWFKGSCASTQTGGHLQTIDTSN
jgi:hypothetical protein